MDDTASVLRQPGEVRGTQSFVHTLSACWERPVLTLLEVTWRWAYGLPALSLVVWQTRRALLIVTHGTLDPATLGLDRQLLNDPVGALSADPLATVGKLTQALGLVLPELTHTALWVIPSLLIGWVVISSFGRGAVLRRADKRLHSRPMTLMALQAIRVCLLAGVFAIWFRALGWCASLAITKPIAAGSEPNIVGYCALVIVLSLGLFTLWAFVSWILSVAPLLAMLSNLGVRSSLAAAFRLGQLRGKLVEINLVLGIVKIALIVLATVFSATPLPFEAITTPQFLAWWWLGVAVLYVLWSDFFHVTRLVAYLNLWRAFEPARGEQLSALSNSIVAYDRREV